MLYDLADMADRISALDCRDANSTSLLHRQLRNLVSRRVLVPVDYRGEGRNAAALFDNSGLAKAAIYAVLSDVGLDARGIEAVESALAAEPLQDRRPGVMYFAAGFNEAIARAGEAGWTLRIEVGRQGGEKVMRGYLVAPDAGPVTPEARRVLAAHDASKGWHHTATILIDLSVLWSRLLSEA